jgi:hypothetical protein
MLTVLLLETAVEVGFVDGDRRHVGESEWSFEITFETTELDLVLLSFSPIDLLISAACFFPWMTIYLSEESCPVYISNPERFPFLRAGLSEVNASFFLSPVPKAASAMYIRRKPATACLMDQGHHESLNKRRCRPISQVDTQRVCSASRNEQ